MQSARTNTFDDEGRIAQIEFAIKNVSQAGTSIGMKCTDGIVFVGLSKKNESHVEKGIEKIYKLTDNIFCIISGLFGDGLQIISIARSIAQDHAYLHGVEITLYRLVSCIASDLQYFTQSNSMRPFGVSFLFASQTEMKLMSCDPAGSINEWKSKAFGTEEDAVNNELANHKEEFSMEEGVFECFRILSLKQEITPKNAEFYEVFLVNEKNTRFLNTSEIKEIVNRVKESTKENE